MGIVNIIVCTYKEMGCSEVDLPKSLNAKYMDEVPLVVFIVFPLLCFVL